jgi:hypothetical protein
MSTPAKNPRSTGSRPRPAKGGGGGFWLVVMLAIGGIGAVFIFAPDLPRNLLGLAKTPTSKGDEPTATQAVKTDLADKDHNAESDLAKTPIKRDGLAAAAKPVIKTATEPEKPQAFTDDAKGQAILAEAEKSYQAMQWQKAATEAHKLDELSVSPKIRVRGKDIANGAVAIERLFRELDDRDELVRYYDTHPSLVLLKSAGSTSLAVPIFALDDPRPVEKSPLDWISQQRRAAGKVAFLIKGKKDYIPGSLPADNIGEVVAADLAAINQEKQSEFESRLNKLKNSQLAGNALAWYDAGKFAYRNRLDSHVAEMLDQAQVLDHDLVSSVREDKAASLFASLVCHMKNGNQKQADAFMAIITRKFSDTDQGKQARLFYEGKTQALLAAAKDAERRRVDDERKRREAQAARAKELGDEKGAKQLLAAKEPEEEPEAPVSATSGDEAVADAAFAKGRDLYNKALDLGNTPERDVYYEKAYQELHKARGLYSALVEKNPTNDALGVKLLECNKLHYGSIKQRRFH